MAVEEEELMEENRFDGLDPEQEVEECSSNEGATMERWYRLAALVLWFSYNTVSVKLASWTKLGIGSGIEKVQANIKADCDYSYSYKRRCGYEEEEDPDDWSTGEIYDSDVTLDNWVGLDDAHKDIAEMAVEEDELMEENRFNGLDPEQEVHKVAKLYLFLYTYYTVVILCMRGLRPLIAILLNVRQILGFTALWIIDC